MCYIVHMRSISIRELHLNTGEWVRRVAEERRLVVTDRGRPVATLVPYEPADLGTPFAQRRVLPAFADLPPVAGDSTRFVAEDRDRS